MNKPTISVTKNASYITTDIDTLHAEPTDFPLRKTAFLCRCGQSQKKPYCDASHARTHFDSSQQKPCSHKKRAYVGDGITIFYNPSLCGHIAACVESLPAVFNPSNTPWIDATQANAEALIAAVKKCPSGALTYQVDGEVEVTEWFEQSSITQIENGPYSITQMKLLPEADVDDCLTNHDHYILCRCGKSARKPLCDGSHHAVSSSEE